MVDNNKSNNKVSNNISKKSSKDYVSEAIVIGAILICVALLVNVSMFKINGSYLVGASPNVTVQTNVTNFPTDSRGNLEVAIQDQFTEIVDLRLSQLISNITILEDTSINDVYINISSVVTPVLDDLVCLKEGAAFYQGEVLEVTPLGGINYQIRVDKPLDFAFTTAGGCSIRNDDWAVDASITPQTFTVSPSGLYDNISWDITRVMLVCSGDGTTAPDPTPDMSSFFTMDAITNGITFRSVDGITKNIFNAKDNFHMVSETYDLTIYPASRFGLFAVTSRRTFNGADKNGVTIRLDAVTNDRFDLIIADDLTAMDQCHAVVQGHVVD